MWGVQHGQGESCGSHPIVHSSRLHPHCSVGWRDGWKEGGKEGGREGWMDGGMDRGMER